MNLINCSLEREAWAIDLDLTSRFARPAFKLELYYKQCLVFWSRTCGQLNTLHQDRNFPLPVMIKFNQHYLLPST